mmetsp:Transcript_9314/g.20155  ORF Transcript_9314/g.20155 Transcript_9314/m.20155 type:complete len:311 (-) Transcript_9314:1381-2313(-)
MMIAQQFLILRLHRRYIIERHQIPRRGGSTLQETLHLLRQIDIFPTQLRALLLHLPMPQLQIRTIGPDIRGLPPRIVQSFVGHIQLFQRALEFQLLLMKEGRFRGHVPSNAFDENLELLVGVLRGAELVLRRRKAGVEIGEVERISRGIIQKQRVGVVGNGRGRGSLDPPASRGGLAQDVVLQPQLGLFGRLQSPLQFLPLLKLLLPHTGDSVLDPLVQPRPEFLRLRGSLVRSLLRQALQLLHFPGQRLPLVLGQQHALFLQAHKFPLLVQILLEHFPLRGEVHLRIVQLLLEPIEARRRVLRRRPRRR